MHVCIYLYLSTCIFSMYMYAPELFTALGWDRPSEKHVGTKQGTPPHYPISTELFRSDRLRGY
jgi:hypothetical protein